MDVQRREMLGWRRTVLVRIIDDGQVLSAEAVGQGRRLPRVTRIPLRTAAEMIAGGVASVSARRARD